jgi:L-iditol 2-dehydrogenase
MKALVKYASGVGNLGIREMPEPTPAAGEVKVEVKYGGVCGTDIHIYHDRYKSYPPVIMGHEWSGVVIELGDGVKTVKVGDRVTGIPAAYTCGHCRYCLEGHVFLCSERLSFGSGRNGAFAKYAVLGERSIQKLGVNVTYKAGALSEPLACVVKAVEFMTGITAGDVVLVSGPGPVGLLAAQLAKAEGGFVVLAGTDVDLQRMAIARQLGIDVTVNVQRDDVGRILRDLTDGYGADVVLECSGTPAATRLGIEVVRKEGKFTQIGLHEHPFELDFVQILLKDLRITASFASSLEAWVRAMTILSQGRVQTEPLVSDILPLSQWEKAFDKINKREGLKILLQPED